MISAAIPVQWKTEDQVVSADSPNENKSFTYTVTFNSFTQLYTGYDYHESSYRITESLRLHKPTKII